MADYILIFFISIKKAANCLHPLPSALPLEQCDDWSHFLQAKCPAIAVPTATRISPANIQRSFSFSLIVGYFISLPPTIHAFALSMPR